MASNGKRQYVYGRNGERFSDVYVCEVDRWDRAPTMIWAEISYGEKKMI